MAVEIRVYPNKLIDSEYELLTCAPNQSIEAWLMEAVPSYKEMQVPLYSVRLDGIEVPADLWAKTILKDGNVLEFFIEPKEPMTIAMVVIAVVSAAAAIYYANQIPDNYNSTTPTGSAIYDANAQGNKPRLMGAIPEHLGRHVNYPDVLNAPRQHYQNDESWKYFLLNVGEGEYEINATEILIGNTSIDNFATDIEHQIFAPGEDVSGHEAHKNFYSAPEVSNGGLEVSAPSYLFIAEEGTGRYIETSFGAIHPDYKKRLRFYDGTNSVFNFPWPVGSNIQLNGLGVDTEVFEGVVDLVDMGGALTDKIVADFGLNVVSVGNKIQLVGADTNDDSYLVKSVSSTEIELTDLEGNDVTWLVPATRVLIRILRDDPLLGLYTVDVADGNAAVYVSKVGDPDWEGFETHAKYYEITAELIDGGIDPVAVGAYSATPVDQATNLIELDFLFDGLGKLNDNGTVSSHSVEIQMQYREIGTTPWVKVSHTFTEATRDQFGRTLVINLPSRIAVEVQVERISHEEDDIRLSEKVTWNALRSELDTVTSYPGMTTIALKIKGSNALSSSAENKVNIIATRKLTTFDGNGDLTQFEATRDIAPAFYYVCLSAGYTDAQIDLDELYRLHLIWQARGDEFNAIFDNEITFWEVIKRILAVGFAEPTLDYGQIIPVRDEKRESLNYMYQADNMIAGSWKVEGSFFDESEPDGIEVEYFSLATKKPETILCLLPSDEGLNPKNVRAFGITSRDKAYQFGMRMRSILRYRRERHTWSTEMDGLNSNYLSYDALGIDIPGFSQTGRVTNVASDNRTVSVDQNLDWSTTSTNYVGIRKVDGTLSGPYECVKGDSTDTLVLASDIDFNPIINGMQEPPLFMFGVDSQWCARVLIKSIKPSGTDKVQLKAVNDDDRVYDFDDALAPV